MMPRCGQVRVKAVMFVDGREVERGSSISCDVCIVGAGPAGLIAASELLDRDMRVCVIESGGFEIDAATQRLSDFEVEDSEDLYPNPRYAHDRRIGGTAEQWDVMIGGHRHVHLTPLDPIDLRHRSWLPHSGWPIAYESLRPYLARAQAACGAGAFDYEPQAWADPIHEPFKAPHLASKILMACPRAFFLETLPRRLLASRNITLLAWSNVVELMVNRDATRVTALDVACLNGSGFQVAARIVVLAQGGFEVPRLLLASRSTAGAGLGNRHDLVGRYLMDRQIVKAGRLLPPAGGGLRAFGFYDMREARGRHVLGKLMLSEDRMQREQVLSNLISFSPRLRLSLLQILQRPFGRGTTSRSPAHRSAHALLEHLRRRRVPRDLVRHLRQVAAGFDDLLYIKVARRATLQPRYNFDSLGWYEVADRDRRFTALDVHQMCEQAPDPENRITLGNDLDATGMPIARVAFRWNRLDMQSILRTQVILKEELAAAGLGNLVLECRNGEPLLAQMSAHHPSGTTRMSRDPRTGVVDSDCRVHGMANLFVASSSVFPTSGSAPPTLTILALAIRVVDKVRSELGCSAEVTAHERAAADGR